MDFDGVERVVVRDASAAPTRSPSTTSPAPTSRPSTSTSPRPTAAATAQADTVVVNGTNQRDVVQVTRSGAQVSVTGLAAQTRITGSEPALDTLLVQTLDGNDDVTVAADVSGLIIPVVDLGAGD